MGLVLERFIFLHVLLLCFLSCVSGNERGDSVEKPNVLIIIADDLGWNDIGFHGSDIKTPNIDSLAQVSTILNRFYVAPQCTPTRAGLLTGRYPGRFGMRYGVVAPTVKSGLPPQEITLAEAFARIGYENRAAFGKWHLGHSNKKYHPLNHGFNYFYGHYNGAIDYFTHKRDAELDWHENYQTSLDKGYSTDLIAERAVEYMTKQDKKGAFFTYVAFNAPHSPMQAKKEELNKYGYNADRVNEDYPIGGQRRGERETETYGRQGRGNTLRQTYSAMVSSLDEAVGRMIGALKTSGQFDNTIIWFLSDNGGTYTFGGDNRPLRGQKHQLWEGGVRAVSLFKGIGTKMEIRQSNAPIAYIDVFPTLFKMVSDSVYPSTIDGINAENELKNDSSSERFIYLGKGGLVSKQWKLVEGQLFNIGKDLSEEHDVSSENKGLMDELTTILGDFEKLDSGSYDYQPKGWVPPRNWAMD